LSPLGDVFGGRGPKPYKASELEASLRMLHESADACARLADRPALLKHAVQTAAAGARAGRAVALLFDREKNTFHGTPPAAGFSDAEAVALAFAVGECGEIDTVFFRGSAYTWPTRVRSTTPEIARRIGARNVLVAPLLAHGERIGVVAIFEKEKRYGDFGDQDVTFVETVARQLDPALGAARHEEMQGAQSGKLSVVKRRFDDFQALEIERAEQLGHSLGCIVIEVADFDSIVETYGRQTAEFAVGQLADRVRQSARHIDVIARDDARTLIVLLPGSDEAALVAFWNRAASNIAATDFPSVGKMKLRRGVACHPGSAVSATDVVLAAMRDLRAGGASSPSSGVA